MPYLELITSNIYEKRRGYLPSSLGLCRLATCFLPRSKKLGGREIPSAPLVFERNKKLRGVCKTPSRPVLFSSIRDGHIGDDSTRLSFKSFQD